MKQELKVLPTISGSRKTEGKNCKKSKKTKELKRLKNEENQENKEDLENEENEENQENDDTVVDDDEVSVVPYSQTRDVYPS